MESIEDFDHSHLPAFFRKIFLHSLGIIVSWGSIDDAICSKRYECVDESSSEKYHLHHSLELVMSGCFQQNLHNKIMNRVTHSKRGS